MPARRSRREVRDMAKRKDERALDLETLRLGSLGLLVTAGFGSGYDGAVETRGRRSR